MNKVWALAAVALVSTAVLSTAALAQGQPATASGEVTKLDAAAERITLKHAGIKHLDMPPMTMAFKVRDAKLLQAVAVGDRVRFAAERIDGQYVLTALAKAP